MEQSYVFLSKYFENYLKKDVERGSVGSNVTKMEVARIGWLDFFQRIETLMERKDGINMTNEVPRDQEFYKIPHAVPVYLNLVRIL
ncbi:hypothetical protein RCL_jg5572.t1 [Rhizophagus clarus]|uniref:Uncharacterized protein n=1 Tax=Rhizophagus clarus TaxID=94130 RepID=A0A8H3M938_9GLOM|nr:hypothetical protein RCL_jg5572.t1 [Rhizophagus clarus]